jgi:hypothetical protein
MITKESFLADHVGKEDWCRYFEATYGNYQPSATPSQLLRLQIQGLIHCGFLPQTVMKLEDDGYRKEIEAIVDSEVIQLQCEWIAEHLSFDLLSYIQGRQLLINNMAIIGEQVKEEDTTDDTDRHTVGVKKIDMFLKSTALRDELQRLENKLFFNNTDAKDAFAKLLAAKGSTDLATVEMIKNSKRSNAVSTK